VRRPPPSVRSSAVSDVPSLVALAGAVPIAVALADVFLTLFHPTVAGPIGSAIQRTTWRASQALGRRRPAALAVAAPAGVLLTIAMWASLLVLGWALVYWPFMEDGFRPQTGAELGRPFVAAVYTSGVTLSTLGYGDLAPAADWLRLLAPVESLLGFGLLTASVSWLLGIYPALHRRRQFARRLAAGVFAQGAPGEALARLSPSGAAGLLQELEIGVAAVSTDLEQLPVTYYFRHDPAETALPRLLRGLVDVCAELRATTRDADVAFRADMLDRGLEELAQRLRHGFLPGAGPDAADVLDAYVADHHAVE
jgi:hypothetical protein